ncbi:uncharacterized protein PGTG_13733 [Puccinia graminis f. sp. tritici CRL 75-36-700-3]|uniref:Uncharacterized protein n=1 Tax=Puccinia graminis f. sp. tritici (strain CRL 75-36-700-3 / race SCCL) TaxID=418459 RepID=E3KDL6_PUCGT|nr:uncharacterized protein PGTG_08408 [Puccinia graminis f. sp. tritici CRL 75-36-700-3]XP_003332348.1 uncharacterized protein PGTG_13733 [Puccinia graminis f. sp. tritici CRL 75-36-700-3]EFP82452.1 hypothetical protein PGTG_08408 [Puccinia graminis f. sp. tritici CRL 75-36-700-3]EFP87929.1 hypothetical protein PGTG_13733 [Puccinia graminis f. sp. tritici CRL 75-36-700-3]
MDIPLASAQDESTEPKRRRTKPEMIIHRAELAKKKEALEAAKLLKKKPHPKAVKTAAGTSGSKSTKPTGAADNNPQFIASDFELICTYLEDPHHYTEIYGNGPRTGVGQQVMTKSAAYDRFAIFMNDKTHKRLHLDGKLLRQRIEAYKKRFVAAKRWADNTGAGIEEGEDIVSIDVLLEGKCPCYERMSALFGEKPNVTPAAQYESQQGMSLYNRPVDNDNPDNPSNPEMFYPGWEPTQEVLDQTTHVNESPDLATSGQANQTSGVDQSNDNPDLPDSLLDAPPSHQPTPPLDSAPVSAMPSTSATPGHQLGSSQPRRTMASMLADLRANISREEEDEVDDAEPSGSAAPRGRFVNQVDRSIPAPRRETNNPKGKSTVAAAFGSSSDKKFAYLDKHMEMEKEKFEWEKSKYKSEQGDITTRENAKMRAAEKWISQGKSPSDIEILMRTVF